MFAVNFNEGQLEQLLHIPEPWYIDQVSFNLELNQLDVYVKFRKRALFTCSDCGATHQPVKDIVDRDRTWRHLNFFEYPCYIHAELPRTDCGSCNRMMRVNVPWALDKPKHY
nr:transposase family protein [Paenibacillus elgii]